MCLGDGSGEDDQEKNEDEQALSSKEMDFRETIIRFESKYHINDLTFLLIGKKKRKERKIKERE